MTSIPVQHSTSSARRAVGPILRLGRLLASTTTRPLRALGVVLSELAVASQMGPDAEVAVGRDTGARI